MPLWAPPGIQASKVATERNVPCPPLQVATRERPASSVALVLSIHQSRKELTNMIKDALFLVLLVMLLASAGMASMLSPFLLIGVILYTILFFYALITLVRKEG